MTATATAIAATPCTIRTENTYFRLSHYLSCEEPLIFIYLLTYTPRFQIPRGNVCIILKFQSATSRKNKTKQNQPTNKQTSITVIASKICINILCSKKCDYLNFSFKFNFQILCLQQYLVQLTSTASVT